MEQFYGIKICDWSNKKEYIIKKYLFFYLFLWFLFFDFDLFYLKKNVFYIYIGYLL